MNRVLDPVRTIAAAAVPVAPLLHLLVGVAIATPFQSSAPLQVRLSGLLNGVLPLSLSLSKLLDVFNAIDMVLMMQCNRRKRGNNVYPAKWNESLVDSVRRLLSRSDVTLDMVGQLLTLYPRCYHMRASFRVDTSGGKQITEWHISFEESPQQSPLQQVNIEARRKEIQQRMLQYIYEAHQTYLHNLQKQTQRNQLAHPDVTVTTLAAFETAAAATGIPTTMSVIATYLATPLSSLQSWFPSFRPDDASYVPVVPVAQVFMQQA